MPTNRSHCLPFQLFSNLLPSNFIPNIVTICWIINEIFIPKKYGRVRCICKLLLMLYNLIHNILLIKIVKCSFLSRSFLPSLNRTEKKMKMKIEWEKWVRRKLSIKKILLVFCSVSKMWDSCCYLGFFDIKKDKMAFDISSKFNYSLINWVWLRVLI